MHPQHCVKALTSSPSDKRRNATTLVSRVQGQKVSFIYRTLFSRYMMYQCWTQCWFVTSIPHLDSWHGTSINNVEWFCASLPNRRIKKIASISFHMLGCATISLLNYAKPNSDMHVVSPDPQTAIFFSCSNKWLAEADGVNKYFKCLQVGRLENESSSSLMCVSNLSVEKTLHGLQMWHGRWWLTGLQSPHIPACLGGWQQLETRAAQGFHDNRHSRGITCCCGGEGDGRVTHEDVEQICPHGEKPQWSFNTGCTSRQK